MTKKWYLSLSINEFMVVLPMYRNKVKKDGEICNDIRKYIKRVQYFEYLSIYAK